MQPHYNLLYREEEREMLKLCAAEKVGVIPWSPLARGRLTRPWQEEPSSAREKTDEYGKKLYTKTRDADKAVVDRVNELAGQRGVSPTQIALAWMLHKPVIAAPIIGASKLHHLDDAVAALEVKLSKTELDSLEQPYVPHEVAGFE
jgi:aryl-alcohol dehydrogenase-like predicted oxidoreductase